MEKERGGEGTQRGERGDANRIAYDNSFRVLVAEPNASARATVPASPIALLWRLTR